MSDQNAIIRAGLTLSQNKHVLRGVKGANPATRQFILSARYYAQKHTKNPKNVGQMK